APGHTHLRAETAGGPLEVVDAGMGVEGSEGSAHLDRALPLPDELDGIPQPKADRLGRTGHPTEVLDQPGLFPLPGGRVPDRVVELEAVLLFHEDIADREV